MAFNGAGAFVRVHDWTADADAAVNIRADRMDEEDDGFATGLSSCITKDGQTTVTANIPMSSKKLTGLAAGSAAGDSVNYTQWIGGNTPGTVTNDSATAGNIGEYLTANASGVALSNGTNANITSKSLTAGEWDVSGTVLFAPTGATITSLQAGVSDTSITFPAISAGGKVQISASGIDGSSGSSLATPTYRLSLASTTTVYLVGEANFSAGSISASGYIRARRVR